MKIRLLYVFVSIACLARGQVACPSLISPVDGSVDVPVDAIVEWNTVGGIDGYSVSLGTSPGDSDILNSRSAALVNSLIPVAGLPDNTEIFVTISMFLDDGSFLTCPSESFITVDVTEPPPCTRLIQSLIDAQNVASGVVIQWDYAPTATGYFLTIGSSAGADDIVPETDLGNVLRYDPVENLPTTTDVYVSIRPYNENGEAEDCIEQMFVTGDSNIDCEQFRPELTFPEYIGLCSDVQEVLVNSDDIADGFRWYAIKEDNSEELISESRSVTISQIGRYRLEAYNGVSILGDVAECTSSTVFTVINSEAAVIRGVEIIPSTLGVDLIVNIAGNGRYEFALDDLDGPFQVGNRFNSVSEQDHVVFVRDLNGCGISDYIVIQRLNKADFPMFFTPNDDGTNDLWQFDPQSENGSSLDRIYIYDRFGRLLQVLSAEEEGWDGTFRGRPVPASTYWYKAIAKNGADVKGYFALKR